MTETPQSENPDSEIQSSLEVERACDRYEAAWSTDKRPEIEVHLQGWQGAARTRLLRELLVLEIEYRRRAGDEVKLAEYGARFPDDSELLNDLLCGPTVILENNLSLGTTTHQLPERFGRYSVRSVLGMGGFGVIYLGFDDELQRQVAINVPRGNVAAPDEYLAEAKRVVQLDHPGIVPVYDVGCTDDGRCYIISKYVEGNDLAERMKEQALSLLDSMRIIVAVAEALHFAHKQGITHRDVKPANILLDRDGNAFVADFGLAIHEAEQRRRAGEISGSPIYMSPEQINGQTQYLDGRTDVWSLGVILFELVTGRRPFSGSTKEELFDEILHREPKPPRMIDDSMIKQHFFCKSSLVVHSVSMLR